jgi:hypothetical protein
VSVGHDDWLSIRAAAEAHLATLPKPLWTVRWSHDVEGLKVRNWLQAECEQANHAVERAAERLRAGAKVVEIIAP